MTPTEAKQAVAAVNAPKTTRGKTAPTDYAAFGGKKFRIPKIQYY